MLEQIIKYRQWSILPFFPAKLHVYRQIFGIEI